MGVVEIERVRENSIHESGGTRWQAIGEPNHGTIRRTTPSAGQLQCHAAGVQRTGRQANSRRVEKVALDGLHRFGRQISEAHSGGKFSKLPDNGLGGHEMTANGRTGIPVAPTTFNGISTNKNSYTWSLESSDKFIASTMWMPFSTSKIRWTGSSAWP